MAEMSQLGCLCISLIWLIWPLYWSHMVGTVLVRNSTSFSPKSSADQIRGVMQGMKNSKDSAQFHPDSYWLVFP